MGNWPLPKTNRMPYYLHDVRSIEEAVLWHDGEAEKAKDQFMNLSSAERGKLIRFLNSL